MNSISAMFQGRLGRAHFAWSLLAFIVIAIAINILTYALGMLGDALGLLASLVSLIAFIMLGIVSLGVAVRRYHDMDWSGWFVLLNFIPFVNIAMLLVLLFKQGTVGANRFGEPFSKDVPLKEAILNKTHVTSTVATAPMTTSVPGGSDVTNEVSAPTEPVVSAVASEPTQEGGPKPDLV